MAQEWPRPATRRAAWRTRRITCRVVRVTRRVVQLTRRVVRVIRRFVQLTRSVVRIIRRVSRVSWKVVWLTRTVVQPARTVPERRRSRARGTHAAATRSGTRARWNMAEVSQLKGTVLRITGVPAGTAEGAEFALAGTGLERGSAFGRPACIEIAGVDPAKIAGTAEHKPKVQGTFADGRFVEVELGDVMPPLSESVVGSTRFATVSVRATDYRPAGWGTPAWVFSLVNFKLGSANRFGLHLTTECRADGSAAWFCDTTSFIYAGREWFLTDFLDGKDDKELREFRRHWTPIQSAELWTEVREGDQREAIEYLARDVVNVLSFASGRCVRWLDCTQLDAHEQKVGSSRHSIWVAAAKDGGNGPIDTGDAEVFRTFMNAACKAAEADPEWWARTLELHLQGALSPIIDVQLTFYYMLLDRVSEKVTGTSWPKQIDPDIDARLRDKEWRKSFESVLQSLSPKWTTDRTDVLVQRIREINNKPPLPKCVAAATAQLGLPEPDEDKVKPRNRLLHSGNLPKELPEDLRHSGDLARAVEALISAMLLRMLGHAGPAYLDDAGRDYLPIHPWPKDRPCPWRNNVPPAKEGG